MKKLTIILILSTLVCCDNKKSQNQSANNRHLKEVNSMSVNFSVADSLRKYSDKDSLLLIEVGLQALLIARRNGSIK